MSDSERLAEKYGRPKSRITYCEANGYAINPQKIPLSRDIDTLMTLALEHDIWIHPFFNLKRVDVNQRLKVTYFAGLYEDYPSKLDALCEALTKALLAD